MGEKGEGFTGTTIKDTWTKTKGSGRLGWGGEMGGKAENYLNRNKNQKYFKKYIFSHSVFQVFLSCFRKIEYSLVKNT